MNEEDMEAVEPLAGEELERMLARFARVRLEPSPGQARRARMAVMEEAWHGRIDADSVPGTAGARTPDVAASTRRRPFGRWSPRRVAVAFTAASIAGLMLGSSVFAASRAGGPLYESRLALESLTLPADPAARAAAQLARADARLGEAVEAGFRHDDNGVAAALGAYDDVLQDLSTTSGALTGEMIAALQRHRTVLLELAAQVPSSATNGIDLALSNSDRAIDRLAPSGGGPAAGRDGAEPGNGTTPNGGDAQGAGRGGGQAGGQAGGQSGGNAAGAGKGAGNGAGSGPGAGGGSGTGTGNGNANGADNGNGGNGGTGSKPAASTPAPTATPTPRPTVAPTEKPPGGPQATHAPAGSPKPHRTSAPPHASSVESASPSPPAGSDAP